MKKNRCKYTTSLDKNTIDLLEKQANTEKVRKNIIIEKAVEMYIEIMEDEQLQDFVAINIAKNRFNKKYLEVN